MVRNLLSSCIGQQWHGLNSSSREKLYRFSNLKGLRWMLLLSKFGNLFTLSRFGLGKLPNFPEASYSREWLNLCFTKGL
jgi:hypothetical protein